MMPLNEAAISLHLEIPLTLPERTLQMVRLVIDDHIPFIKGVLEPYARVTYAPGGIIGKELAKNADGLIIRTRTQCNHQLLEGSPVRFIASATIGADHIDAAFCAQKNIQWHHAPGCNSSSVKQYIASVLVNLYFKYDWVLSGQKIGIIGAGNIGSKVAELSRMLGMIPLLNDPPRERSEGSDGFVSMRVIQQEADVISFHVPLITEGPDMTFGLANDDFYRPLRKKPFMINTSRGPVVQSKAAVKALRSGLISGFAADVWENEPAIDPEFLGLCRIATPHIAGYSAEGKANGTAACVRAASRFFGFGIDHWYPPALPEPQNPVIPIDNSEKSALEVLAHAILESYDVMQDDRRLRAAVSDFEKLRNDYPVRREFEAFTITLSSADPTTEDLLRAAGFILKT